jgi:hypothetical protein
MAIGLTSQSLAAMKQPPDGAPAVQLDLGAEVADDLLAGDGADDFSLGEEIGSSGDIDSLTLGRVEVDTTLPDQTSTETAPGAAPSPTPASDSQVGSDLANIVGLDSSAPIASGPGQPRPLAPVPAPAGQGPAAVPLPIALPVLLGVVGLGGWISRRFFL